MKNLLIIIIAVVAMSCIKTTVPNKPFIACMHNGTFSKGYQNSYIYCDSFQMINSRTAIIWVDGKDMKIIADLVRFETNIKSGSIRE